LITYFDCLDATNLLASLSLQQLYLICESILCREWRYGLRSEDVIAKSKLRVPIMDAIRDMDRSDLASGVAAFALLGVSVVARIEMPSSATAVWMSEEQLGDLMFLGAHASLGLVFPVGTLLFWIGLREMARHRSDRIRVLPTECKEARRLFANQNTRINAIDAMQSEMISWLDSCVAAKYRLV